MANVFAAAISAAASQVAKETEPVEDVAPEDFSKKDFRLEEAQKRLAAVLGVNRTLHTALSEKRKLLEESKDEAEALHARLAGRSAEEPLRRSKIEELQMRTQVLGPTQVLGTDMMGGPSAVKEAKELINETTRLEQTIEYLNIDNLSLADQHREDRARVAEHQARLRTLGKRERELARQLDFIAGSLSEASAAAAEAAHPGTGAKGTDYKNMPGLYLSKLLARYNFNKEPPQLMKSSSMLTPQAEMVGDVQRSVAESAAETVAEET